MLNKFSPGDCRGGCWGDCTVCESGTPAIIVVDISKAAVSVSAECEFICADEGDCCWAGTASVTGGNICTFTTVYVEVCIFDSGSPQVTVEVCVYENLTGPLLLRFFTTAAADEIDCMDSRSVTQEPIDFCGAGIGWVCTITPDADELEKPCCPEDCDCPLHGSIAEGECPVNCCPDPPTDFVTVDLGAGGLSESDCVGNGCVNLAGQFDLAWRGIDPECRWLYDIDDYCLSTCGSSGSGCDSHWDLIIGATINAVTCKAEVIVSLDIVSDGTCACDIVATTTYATSSSIANCTGSVTLNRITDGMTDACSGSLPATITLNFG